MGKPSNLVDLRPELQQRDASGTPQRARLVGRHPRRSRHAVLGARGDRAVSAARRMGLAPGAAHRARAAARPPAAVAAVRNAACSGAVRSAPAEELAAAQRPWRHSRRSVHDRGAVHRRAACRRCVLRCRASVPHRRHLALALCLRHQHLLAHRALGAALDAAERMGQCLIGRGEARRQPCWRHHQARLLVAEGRRWRRGRTGVGNRGACRGCRA